MGQLSVSDQVIGLTFVFQYSGKDLEKFLRRHFVLDDSTWVGGVSRGAYVGVELFMGGAGSFSIGVVGKRNKQNLFNTENGRRRRGGRAPGLGMGGRKGVHSRYKPT